MLAFREHPKRIGISTQNNTILCNQVRTKILSALKWETLTFKRSMSPILRLIIYNIEECEEITGAQLQNEKKWQSLKSNLVFLLWFLTLWIDNKGYLRY